MDSKVGARGELVLGNRLDFTLALARGSGGRRVARFKHPSARPFGVPSIDLIEANQRRGE